MHMIYSDTRCALGEGAFWHPQRQALFWFDILGKRMLARDGRTQSLWGFSEMVSAAGWVDADTLVIVSETGLYKFTLSTGDKTLILSVEADNTVTRSNDGRADRQGGFWFGTMGKNAEPGAGAIYRYYKGDFRKLYDAITIPNAICFSPDGDAAYYADTTQGTIHKVALDGDGWPCAQPTPFVALQGEGLNPDGAVIDAHGNLWNAQWGASRVACYDSHGRFVSSIGFMAEQISCPAFGGPEMKTLFATSAAVNADPQDQWAGVTFSVLTTTQGLPEPRVLLDA